MTDIQALSDAAEKLLRVWPMQKAREAARVELAAALVASPSPDTDREPIDGPKCWTCGKPCGHVYAQPIDRESPDTDAGLDVAWAELLAALSTHGWDWSVNIEHQESGNNVTEPHEEWFTVRLTLGHLFRRDAQVHMASHPELDLALRELTARLATPDKEQP